MYIQYVESFVYYTSLEISKIPLFKNVLNVIKSTIGFHGNNSKHITTVTLVRKLGEGNQIVRTA